MITYNYQVYIITVCSGKYNEIKILISCYNNTALLSQFTHANEENFQHCTDNTPAVTHRVETLMILCC